MITIALLGMVFLGIAASLGLAVLAGCLFAFGEERLEIEPDELAERWRGPRRGPAGMGPVEPSPPRTTTTQRPRLATAQRVTAPESAVVSGPIPPAPARRMRAPFMNTAG